MFRTTMIAMTLLIVVFITTNAQAGAGDDIFALCNVADAPKAEDRILCVQYHALQRGVISANYSEGVCFKCVAACEQSGSGYAACRTQCALPCFGAQERSAASTARQAGLN